MPRAYIETIRSSNPAKRRSCLGISCGSNVPVRSRGTSMRSGPSSVSTVLPLRPLRWLPLPPSASARCRPSSAPSARSITAFFSCWNTASTPAASIGPGISFSRNSFGRSMAGVTTGVFFLRGIHAPWQHHGMPLTQNF
ncbi:hypothetical protein ECD227_4108 (plasmid) [Escherichia fergusonii ECD227]|nr:hypothetical protein ECD227_4108 [Escherichia fergusonii ECD227]